MYEDFTTAEKREVLKRVFDSLSDETINKMFEDQVKNFEQFKKTTGSNRGVA